MRKILFLVCILSLPCVSFAQTNQPSWTALSVLSPGQNIQVIDTASKKHTGLFASTTESAITLTEPSGAQTIQKQDIRSVKLMKNTHRLRNTLIGAGIGAGAGAAITAGGWESNGFLGGKGVGAAVGAIIGGASGAIIGALVPSHATIYKATSL
jgi:hypothetical protein